MLTLKQIRDDRANTIARLAVKGVDAAPVVDQVIAEDDRRKSLQQQLDTCLAEQNTLSKEIGKLFASGRREEAETAKNRVSTLKEEPHPSAAESNADLDQLLEAAVPETAEQLTAFFRAIEEETPVPHWFDRDFKGNPPRPTQHISWPSGRTRHLTVT